MEDEIDSATDRDAENRCSVRRDTVPMWVNRSVAIDQTPTRELLGRRLARDRVEVTKDDRCHHGPQLRRYLREFTAMVCPLPQHLPGNRELIRERPCSNRIEVKIPHLDLPAIEINLSERKSVKTSLGWSIAFVRERNTRQQGRAVTMTGLGEEAIGESLRKPAGEYVDMPVRYFLKSDEVDVCVKNDSDRSLEVGVAREDVVGRHTKRFSPKEWSRSKEDGETDEGERAHSAMTLHWQDRRPSARLTSCD